MTEATSGVWPNSHATRPDRSNWVTRSHVRRRAPMRLPAPRGRLQDESRSMNGAAALG